MGMLFEKKSAFCSGLCPILPVEIFYGQRPAIKTGGAVCPPCTECVDICPDISGKETLEQLATNSSGTGLYAHLLIAGFPGYVYGFFQIPRIAYAAFDFFTLWDVYSNPLVGMLMSLGLYDLLKRLLPLRAHRFLAPGFAALAVSIYYWYKIPSLIGFAKYPQDTLLDLTDYISQDAIWGVRAVIPLLILIYFFWKEPRPAAG